jgi:hypothetical protein
MIDGSVIFSFETKNAFASNNIHCRSWRNESPSAIVEEGIKLAVLASRQARYLAAWE